MNFFLRILFFTVLIPANAQNERFSMQQVGYDHLLNYPWEVIYGPDDMLWVTERVGKRVLRIDPESGEKDELIKIAEVYQSSTQDGLLGMALHPDLGKGLGQDYVYVSYSYEDNGRAHKLVRYTYSLNGNDGILSGPVDLITGLPSSNDHNSGRLLFGPDGKLYYTIGDQGKNQYENVCETIMAQALPTQREVDNHNRISYQGKILRINPDGSIPADNPVIHGVQSHIYSYGHRNPQGLVITSNGHIFSVEHGPKSDDELNLILAGKNYGWPHVAGYIDDQAYTYCQWSTADNCGSISYDDFRCPDTAMSSTETSWSHPDFVPPLETYYTVEDNYNFTDPDCDVSFICWPTIAPSGIDVYESESIAGWRHSLLLVSLKRGRVYRQPINANGEITGEAIAYWDSQNRYRDIAIHPNGTTFFIVTDNSGQTSGPSSGNTSKLENPGALLRFDYIGDPLTTKTKPDQSEQIKIGPNPVASCLKVTYSGNFKGIPKELKLLNMDGKVTYKTAIQTDQLDLNVSGFTNGLYLLQTTIQGMIFTEKVLIKN